MLWIVYIYPYLYISHQMHGNLFDSMFYFHHDYHILHLTKRYTSHSSLVSSLQRNCTPWTPSIYRIFPHYSVTLCWEGHGRKRNEIIILVSLLFEFWCWSSLTQKETQLYSQGLNEKFTKLRGLHGTKITFQPTRSYIIFYILY